MELGPEDVSLLERCPHFRGWYVQASIELEPEDESLLERCPRVACLVTEHVYVEDLVDVVVVLHLLYSYTACEEDEEGLIEAVAFSPTPLEIQSLRVLQQIENGSVKGTK